MKRFALIILLTIFLFSPCTIFPQKHPNSIYLELFGHGIAYSINYDRLLSPNLGLRIGFGYFDFVFAAYMVPLSMNFLIGEGNSKLELGAGVTYASVVGILGESIQTPLSGAIPNFTIGYRYQPAAGGFLFRIGFTPMLSSKGIQPWGGLSVGTTF